MLILKNHVVTKLVLLFAAINSSFVLGCSCIGSTRAERQAIANAFVPAAITETIDHSDPRFEELLRKHCKSINLICHVNGSKRVTPIGKDILEKRREMMETHSLSKEHLLLDATSKPLCLIMHLKLRIFA